MKLFTKNVFYSPYMFATLLCLSTSNADGMFMPAEQKLKTKQTSNPTPSINPLAPLQTLWRQKSLTEQLIEQAFNKTFVLLCAMIKELHPCESKQWIEEWATQEKIELHLSPVCRQNHHGLAHKNTLLEELASKNIINSADAPSSTCCDPAVHLALKTNKARLFKKIALLVKLLSDKTNQRPQYFDDAQLLQQEVEWNLWLSEQFTLL